MVVRRILASHALASVGMSMVWPLLLVEVWERTHNDALLGATGAARMLPYVALSWAAGRLADAADRGRIVRLTLIWRSLAMLTAAIAATGGAIALAVAASAAAVAMATPAYPALAAALPEIAPAHHRRATDVLVTVEVSSFVVGPALGGLLLWPPSRPWLVWVALGLVVAALPLLPARLCAGGALGQRSRRPSVRSTWCAGLTRVLGVMALVNFVIATLALALVPMSEGRWQGSAATYGLATGVLGFGALAGPLLSGGRRSVTSSMVLRLGGLGLVVASVAPAPGVGWALPSLALAGASAVAVEASATAVLQDAVPDEVRASVLGLADTVMVGAALLGALFGPALVGWWGPSLVVMALAAVTVAATAAIPRSAAASSAETVATGVSNRLVPQ